MNASAVALSCKTNTSGSSRAKLLTRDEIVLPTLHDNELLHYIFPPTYQFQPKNSRKPALRCPGASRVGATVLVDRQGGADFLIRTSTRNGKNIDQRHTSEEYGWNGEGKPEVVKVSAALRTLALAMLGPIA
ncbi:hypothetical protein O1611_g10525 [Lasiodiplodia mahajangana]|uniref:Uncharacterized protein n=1 Tax=Lasiodiplodia mahajangana TaxID=1108764 RepID=A0ACC2IXX7_9PEZI|nr:hypothetical protein O1611_g10525 [Lasiodiplodia mahajangana]